MCLETSTDQDLDNADRQSESGWEVSGLLNNVMEQTPVEVIVSKITPIYTSYCILYFGPHFLKCIYQIF